MAAITKYTYISARASGAKAAPVAAPPNDSSQFLKRRRSSLGEPLAPAVKQRKTGPWTTAADMAEMTGPIEAFASSSSSTSRMGYTTASESGSTSASGVIATGGTPSLRPLVPCAEVEAILQELSASYHSGTQQNTDTPTLTNGIYHRQQDQHGQHEPDKQQPQEKQHKQTRPGLSSTPRVSETAGASDRRAPVSEWEFELDLERELAYQEEADKKHMDSDHQEAQQDQTMMTLQVPLPRDLLPRKKHDETSERTTDARDYGDGDGEVSSESSGEDEDDEPAIEIRIEEHETLASILIGCST